MRFQTINPNKDEKRFRKTANKIRKKNINITQTRGGVRL